ncbi:hypothetical protein F4780DRAFT_773103 [Xylariomycetidae sp. FL0641]|nr:hypothetical protein F4780DRAFT_773103 [Xylariomycetidae sp. FL0641]
MHFLKRARRCPRPAFLDSAAGTTSLENTDASATTLVSSVGNDPTVTPSPTPIPHDQSGLGNGAIAGIAIATAVLGAIIGAAIVLLLKRRKRHHAQPEYLSMEFGGKEKGNSSGMASDRLRLNDFLLDAKPDSQIGSELRSLGHLIQQHVETNYHLQPIQTPNALVQSLSRLGLDRDASISAKQLAVLAEDPRTRHHAIQHVLSKAIFSSTSLSGSSPVSLLPPPIAAFHSMIPPTENHRGSRQAAELALSQWRQLSAFLLHPHRSDRTPLTPTEDVSTHQAHALAMALNSFLEPFVTGDREGRYEQENHLREVIVECATFGYLLFSQPAEYRFVFGGTGKQNTIVVCPGLDKVTDEDGRLFPSPVQPVVAPMVEMI